MDGAALKLAQDTAIDAQAKRIPAGYESKIVAVPNDYRLVDLEQFDAGRRRFRGMLVTDSLEDFAQYVKDNKGGQGFILAQKMKATVFFNLGNAEDAGHADWRAALELPTTPAYAALLDFMDDAHNQQDTIEFLEDWAFNLSGFTEAEDGLRERIDLKKIVRAVRKLEIKETSATGTTQEQYRVAQSHLNSVEASSTEGLPDGLTFTTAPYLGLSVRTFTLRLSILTGGRAPALKLRIVGHEQAKEDMAQEFKKVLAESIGKDASLTIGTFSP